MIHRRTLLGTGALAMSLAGMPAFAQPLLATRDSILLPRSGSAPRIVIAGGIETAPEDCRAYSLCELAGSTDRAMTDPAHWLAESGGRAAADLTAEWERRGQ